MRTIYESEKHEGNMRSKRRWDNNIKMNLKETMCEAEDQIQVTRDSVW
jgi:hypothetical protein